MSDRFARIWRRMTGFGDAALVPQARLSGPMPWVIAIMVAMTGIAAAAGLALQNTAKAAAAELEGGVTVQIVEAATGRRDAQAREAVVQLRAMAGVSAVRLVPQSEVDRLVEPWLGADTSGEAGIAIPVPALIDVQLDRKVSPERIAAIQRDLRVHVPSARVDAQSAWLDPVFDAIKSLQWLAIALVLLLAGALAAAVLLAARSALGANRETIEIVHLLGGTDSQIAGVFQRSMGIDAASGGIVGLGLAVVVIQALGRSFSGLGAGMVDNGTLGWADWALIAMIPLAAMLLAMITARITVVRALRKIV